MKKYIATLKAENENIEEDIILNVCGYEINCFSNICPFQIKVDEKYEVELSLVFFDDIHIEEIDSTEMKIKKMPEGYSYVLNGIIKGGVFDCGIKFHDQLFDEYFEYLEGKYVRFLVDRIDVEFLCKA